MRARVVRFAAALQALLLIATLLVPALASATVWTDQADYAPGSVVTISGDNSNGAGYTPGETVVVNVVGPNGYTASCSAVTDEAGAWSCQITLWDSDLAVGDYAYTAKGQTSGVAETGTFTDAAAFTLATPNATGSPGFVWHRTGEVAGGIDVSVTGTYRCQTTGGAPSCSNASVLITFHATNGAADVGSVLQISAVNVQKTISLAGSASAGTPWSTTFQFRTSPGVGQFGIPLDGTFEVKAVFTPSSGAGDAIARINEDSFGVDNAAPTSAVTSVTGSAAGVTASGTASDPAGGSGLNSGTPKPVHIEIRSTSCTGTTFPGSGNDQNATGGTWSYTASAFPTAPGTYYVASQATDIAGNVQSGVGCMSYTIVAADTTVDQPTLLTPANGSATADNTPTFDWTDVSDSSTPVTYFMQYAAKGVACDFTSATTTGSLSASTFTPAGSIGSDGIYCWRAKAIDGLANDSGYTAPFEFTLDTAGPVITATATKADSTAYIAGTWTNQSVTVTFTCSDGSGSGLASNTVGGGGTENGDTATGSFTNTGGCTDNAGNTAVSNTFSPIKVDKTAPVISATATKADSTTYVADTWTNQSVTVSFSCADALSGLASNTVGGGGTENGDTATGSFTNTGGCTDNAGNTAVSNTFSPIKVDKTAPVISGSAAPAANANGWNSGSVAVSFSCADAGLIQSGIVTDTVSGDDQTLTAETSGTTVSSNGDCIDAAGNSDSSASVGPIRIDLTDPSVAITSPATGTITVASTIIVSGTASDTPSGIDTVTVNGGPDAVLGAGTFSSFVDLSCGANTISAVATDLAGRTTTSGSITVTRVCAGSLQYYAPIDQSTTSTPIINKGKFGRVIPVKVTATVSFGAAAVNLTESVLNANGLTLRIGVNLTSCTNTATSDLVEAYADAGASNGNTNLFRWSTSQWIYNLDTGNAPSVVMSIGSCYRLDVRLVDAGGASVLLSSGPTGPNPYAIFQPTR